MRHIGLLSATNPPFSMKRLSFFCLLIPIAVAPAADPVQTLPPVVVTAAGLSEEPGLRSETVVSPDHQRLPDAAEILRTLPGAAIVRNGPQTGLVQARGLTGDRVKVLIDGRTITPACPNHMDPPLHYARLAPGDTVGFFAGLAPVSQGGDSLGAVLDVSRGDPAFLVPGARTWRGSIGSTWRSDQDSWLSQADLAAIGKDLRFAYRGSFATGNDLRYPGGRVADTSFETQNHSVSGAWRTAGGFVEVEAGGTRSRDTGTPALPMDMIEDDSWHVAIRQKETLAWGTLENRVYLSQIDHLMDNFSLRPASAMPMEAPASSRDVGWRADLTLPRDEDTWRLGLDIHHNAFEATQVVTGGMDEGMSRDTFHDNRRDRFGLYGDWERKWSKSWTSRLGLRGDAVVCEAGAVDSEFGGPAVAADQARFNKSDRSFADWLPEAVAATRFSPSPTTSVDLAAGLKSRAPSLLERFLWTPANASAGLADGRTYLGNPNLDPETAVELAIGVTESRKSWSVGFTPFYRIIDGFIQGMPTDRLDPSGRPVLQYQNIDQAVLWGGELAASFDIKSWLRLEAAASYTRGRNEDTGDDLYRIAPLRGNLDLVIHKDAWESHLECIWAADQNRVSDLQDEPATPGYALLNFRVSRSFDNGMRLGIGIDNILDTRYEDHLGGINRVPGGDLVTGERIPGGGRGVFLDLAWTF